ncbi:MAG TPA: FAD:protein FMN transferase [Acidimicrobiales bacterium]|nr:FAD:protein FMN transferase [Acidimicrobiales bacterium]
MRRVELVWGSAISIELRDPADVSVLDEVFEWFDLVDRLFSTWREDSEITRFANGQLEFDALDDNVVTVLELAEILRIDTNGAFDIRATAALPEPHGPGWCAIDPSGLVKGWAVERAAAMLERFGAVDFWIDAGGDVVTRGTAPTGKSWRIGIQHPWQRDVVAAIVSVGNGAVATSGRYERGEHVICPRTGEPSRGLASVTVVGDDLARADAYATAVMALGVDGLDWLANRDDIDAMVITDDEVVWTTPHFARWRVDSH